MEDREKKIVGTKMDFLHDFISSMRQTKTNTRQKIIHLEQN